MTDPGLHIAVDGRELVGLPTGVGRYLSTVLDTWAADPAFPHRLTVVVPTDPPAGRRLPGRGSEWRSLRSDRAGLWWEQVPLARALSALRPDVFFAAGYSGPLRLPCPSVTAVYDVSFFAHPEWFSFREGWRRRLLTRAAARRARFVITISRFSADEIVRWMGIARDRIVLARPGAPPVASVDPPPEGREPLVLFVGSLFNRRRIPELIDAFAQTARSVPEARLILVGDNRTRPRLDPRRLAADLALGDRVEWREYVPDGTLADLYARARVFAFLSDYEGFGLTPFEALAAGAAPVLLDTPVTREIYAGAARLVPPDPPAIAGAITGLLSDESARRALVAAGRRRLLDFSWTTCAATIRRALEEAAGR